MAPAPEARKRQVAVITNAYEVTSATYIPQEGWEPDYVLTKRGTKIVRANIIATVILKLVEETSGNAVLLIDDGSGAIKVRTFGDPASLDSYREGDLIMIIGRVRALNEERYLVPEIVKKLTNPVWYKVRQQELQRIGITPEQQQPNEQPTEEPTRDIPEQAAPETPLTLSEHVYAAIREQDKGEGVDAAALISQFGTHHTDTIIRRLLEEGEIFELRPGKLKVLE